MTETRLFKGEREDGSWESLEAWAVAQFGPRPDAPDAQTVREAEDALRVMMRQRDAQRQWDASFSAALMATKVKVRK